MKSYKTTDLSTNSKQETKKTTAKHIIITLLETNEEETNHFKNQKKDTLHSEE